MSMRPCALLLQLLLVVGAWRFVSATFNVMSVPSTPHLLDSGHQVNTVAIDLKHIQHMDSPYSQRNLTVLQRVQLLVTSSINRQKYLARRIHGKQTTFGMENEHGSPVGYDGHFNYFTHIFLGTPPIKQEVLIDTGSDLLWVQCERCVKCFEQRDEIFARGKSSSYGEVLYTDHFCQHLREDQRSKSKSTPEKCLYKYTYADESSSAGDLALEDFTFTTVHDKKKTTHRMPFGCGHENDAVLHGMAGIAGLARGDLSLISILGKTVFSYCLLNFTVAETATTTLLLGSAGNLELKYTPMVDNHFSPGLYYLHLEGISVGNDRVKYAQAGIFDIDSNGNGGLLIDSGSQYSMFVKDIFTPFLEAVRAKSPRQYCVSGGESGLQLCHIRVGKIDYPTVVFHFKDLDITLPHDNLFVEIFPGCSCFGFKMQEEHHLFSTWGVTQQQNYYIAYDIGGHQIGFTRHDCGYGH